MLRSKSSRVCLKNDAWSDLKKTQPFIVRQTILMVFICVFVKVSLKVYCLDGERLDVYFIHGLLIISPETSNNGFWNKY